MSELPRLVALPPLTGLDKTDRMRNRGDERVPFMAISGLVYTF
jgi:hypothetical protein